MTKGAPSSPKFVKRTRRVRRHSIDHVPGREKGRGRLLVLRKSKTRLFSVPLTVNDDDMYFSEPDIGNSSALRSSSLQSDKSDAGLSRANSDKLILVAHPKVGDSVMASEDEDGTLFKTLTSEGADQIKEHTVPNSPSAIQIKTNQDNSCAFSFFESIQAELEGVAETAQESRLPRSFLSDYVRLPFVIEYVVNHGILTCLSCLLYELTFMPLSAFRGFRKKISGNYSPMTWIEYTDFLRTSILIVAAIVFNASIDFSEVYHYIRAQSLLKLYFIFNMMEIIERLVRSWGNDLVDGMIRRAVISSDRWSMMSLGVNWVVVLIYTIIHSIIHFWRVMLISVAILANDMLIVLVTNNFNELKGTVFKKNEPRSVYPVLTSDVVERLYLFIDVALMLFRMTTSPQRSKIPFGEVSIWIAVMIGLEIITDWMKFLCLSKFNSIENGTYWHYHSIHREDIINSRNVEMNPIPPLVQKGYVSASHLPARRMNFMPTPLAVLILCNLMLPNLVGADPLSLWAYRSLVVVALFLLKIGIDWLLLNDASKDRKISIPEKLQNIRSL